MRKTTLFTLIICCLTPAVRAQSLDGEAPPKERVYVATDKDNYLSGEIVWMKLITTDDRKAPLVFSKVGYVELVGESASHARARIEIRGGVGEGTMVLPSSLPTGWYRLVGYTRYMRGEGTGVFFEKRVGVVNPVIGDVPRGHATGGDAVPAPPRPASNAASDMAVSADRAVYSPRSEVRMTISGIPADIHTLGISVTAADPTGNFTAPGLGAWTPPPAVTVSPDAEWDAEWEGATVTGRLVSTDTGQATYSASILPLVSFPGDGIHLFGGSVDPSGKVVFRTRRATGFDEVVTSMRGNESQGLRIDVDDPFIGGAALARPLPSFPLESIDRQSVSKGSLSMQVQYSYMNDSLSVEKAPAPMFYERPRYSYIMKEWRRFATMREVITEFVNVVQFRRTGRRDGMHWHLDVINPDFGTVSWDALVLLDGIPVIDHDIIFNYNPLLIERIDVYDKRYIFGNNLFYGIVALYTAQNTYPELQPDPFTQISSYESPQSRRMFYSPAYDEGRLASRLPDFRHTLYWDAEVEIGAGDANVAFFTSDLIGTYRVLVEGITSSGQPVSATCELKVEK
jgi:hypothetical protein